MATTPRPLIDAVVRSVCGRAVEGRSPHRWRDERNVPRRADGPRRRAAVVVDPATRAGPFTRRARWRAAGVGSRAVGYGRRRAPGTGTHSIPANRGIRHELQPPDELFVGRVTRIVDQAFGPAAAAVVERRADLLRNEVMTR